MRTKDFSLAPELIKKLITSTKIKTELAEEIILNEKIHTATIGFVGCDRISHPFIHRIGNHKKDELSVLIKEYFQALDDAIKKLCECKKWDDIFIVSDHGLTEKKYSLYINSLLINKGFAKPNRSITGLIKERARKHIVSHFGSKIRSLIRKRSSAVGIKTNVPFLKWDETSAFGYHMHGIYINTEIKYSKGIVSSSNYKDLVNRIIESLTDLKMPNGEKLFKKLLRREEIFEGKYLNDAPDIVFEVASGVDICPELTSKGFLKEHKINDENDDRLPTVHNGIHSCDPILMSRSHKGTSQINLTDLANLITK